MLLVDKEEFYWFECVQLIRKVALCAVLRLVEDGSASQILTGIVFCVAYLAFFSYLSPYEHGENNLFDTLCQVMLLFVLISAFSILLRGKLADSYELIINLNGPAIPPEVDERWYNECVAIFVCVPTLVGLLLAALFFARLVASRVFKFGSACAVRRACLRSGATSVGHGGSRGLLVR